MGLIFLFRNLNIPDPKCMEPDRLTDKTWTDVKSLDFACKPTISVSSSTINKYKLSLRADLLAKRKERDRKKKTKQSLTSLNITQQ